MSQQLINHSPDLKRLRDEGYDVEIQSSFLLLKNVPYVNNKKEIKFGILVSELNLAGNIATKPNTHIMHFIGEYPCNKDGTEIGQIKHESNEKSLCQGLIINHSFSSKPKDGYNDFYDKMVTYAAIISSQAHSIDPSVSARTFPVIEPTEDESVFNYLDTASSRAGISNVTKKLELDKIGIIGVGGTGSYVLDLVSKTPVKEIHIFDGDAYLNHNAFRSPCPPEINELKQKPQKADYFKKQYSKMHRHIIAHNCFIDVSNIDLLKEMNFIFLCLDASDAKRLIVDKLEEWNKPFVDVGMGINEVDGALCGILRVTTSTEKKRDHVHNKNRISFSGTNENNEYAKNIQIADLNALNAALAVIKWKKIFGFYIDFEQEHFSTYTIDGNVIINKDQICDEAEL